MFQNSEKKRLRFASIFIVSVSVFLVRIDTCTGCTAQEDLLARSPPPGIGWKQKYSNKKGYFCVRNRCYVGIVPGQHVHIDDSIKTWLTLIPLGIPHGTRCNVELWKIPNSRYCFSMYIDKDTGFQCDCISPTCYSHFKIESSKVHCTYRKCFSMLSMKEPEFCGALLPRRLVKFVPVSFNDQSYFMPGIRVVERSVKNGSGKDKHSGVQHARNLYLNYELGETQRVFNVTINGSAYEIFVEKKEEDNLICGTYREGGREISSGCVPIPELKKPAVYPGAMGLQQLKVVFQGCSHKRNCEFLIRVGEKSSNQLALEAIRPNFNREYTIQRYAICPGQEEIPLPSIEATGKGTTLCKDGSKPRIKYRQGSGNLTCLTMGKRFLPDISTTRKIELYLRQINNFNSSKSFSIKCVDCAPYFADEHTLFRDSNGEIDTSRYNAVLQQFSHSSRDARKHDAENIDPQTHIVSGALIHKRTFPLEHRDRRLIGDDCSGVQDISLYASQALLDSIEPISAGVVYIRKDHLSRYVSIKSPEDHSMCPYNDKVMFRYSPTFEYEEKMQEFSETSDEPQDQGLCIVDFNSMIYASASRYWDVASGVARNFSPKKYKYSKNELFSGCNLLRVEIIGPQSSEIMQAVIEIKRRGGIKADFIFSKNAKLPNEVVVCPESVTMLTKKDTIPDVCFRLTDAYDGEEYDYGDKAYKKAGIALVSIGKIHSDISHRNQLGEIRMACIQ